METEARVTQEERKSRKIQKKKIENQKPKKISLVCSAFAVPRAQLRQPHDTENPSRPPKTTNLTHGSLQQRPTYSSSQPLAQYQQRAHTAAANAVSYQTNAQHTQSPFNRTASPANPKPVNYGQQTYGQTPQPVNVQPRPQPMYATQQQYAQTMPTSGRATPSYPSQPQTPVNGYQQRPPPPPLQQAMAPRAASGTPQPQAAQQMAQQVQAQVQANGHA